MQGRKKFYRLYGAKVIGNDAAGAVLAESETPSWELLPDEGWVTWPMPEFYQDTVKWTGPLGDWVRNDLGRRLCSKRLKDVLERFKAACDVVQWVPAYVTNAYGLREKYYFLHFPEPLDVLDPEKSVFDQEAGILIKPYLSISKVGDHRLFTLRGLEVTTIVSESVRQILETEGIATVTFAPIPAR